MTKRIHAKHKIDRRLGENIWGRPKSPFNKREYGPGEHGQRRRGKLSDYGQQLRAKQKLKGYYGNITEKQFKAIYREASRLRGDTSEKLIGLLERRLDAIVYRAKFVPTVFAARQFVSHGHVRVNGRRVNIPSYRCRDGEVHADSNPDRRAVPRHDGAEPRHRVLLPLSARISFQTVTSWPGLSRPFAFVAHESKMPGVSAGHPRSCLCA